MASTNAPFGTLINYPRGSRAFKVFAAAALSDLPLATTPDFAFGVTMQTPESLANFPLAKVPAVLGADGTALFEGDAIAQYVAESGPLAAQLLGTGALQRARIRQWISVADAELVKSVGTLVAPRWGFGVEGFTEEVERKAMEQLYKVLGMMEKELGRREEGGWIVEGSEGVSLADLSLAGALCWAFENELDAEAREGLPRVVEWYMRIVTMEKLKDVFGPLKLLEKRTSLLAKKE